MKKEDCIFCKLANGEIPTNTLYEDDNVRVIFDLSPASKGHVLILPKEHFDDIFSMTKEAAGNVFETAVKLAPQLKEAVQCEGMNIVQNNGEIAGQTVFHFHMHMIPRYKDDQVRIGWTPGRIDEEAVQRIIAQIHSK